MNAEEAIRSLRVILRLIGAVREGNRHETHKFAGALSDLERSVADDESKLEKVRQLRIALNRSILSRLPAKTTFEPEFQACESLMRDFDLGPPDW